MTLDTHSLTFGPVISVVLAGFSGCCNIRRIAGGLNAGKSISPCAGRSLEA